MNQEERRKEAWGTRHDKRLRAGVIRGENTNKREAQKGAEKKEKRGREKERKEEERMKDQALGRLQSNMQANRSTLCVCVHLYFKLDAFVCFRSRPVTQSKARRLIADPLIRREREGPTCRQKRFANRLTD